MIIEQRVRTWICPCCHNWHRRYKSEKESPYRCNKCNVEYIKARKYPNSKNCCHRRIEIRRYTNLNRLQKTYYPKIRNKGGKVLKFSKETKSIWKRIKKSKTISTFQKYAQFFIDSIDKDSNNYKETDYAKKLYRDGTLSRERGGFCSPKIVIKSHTTYKGEDNKLYGTFGTYHTHIIEGINQIEISKDAGLEHMKKTLLHECLHCIDGWSKTPTNHDCYFYQRLQKLETIFKL